MSKKQSASEKTVQAFIRAVYPESTELCMAVKSEEDILREATRLILGLRTSDPEKQKLVEALREATVALEYIAEQAGHAEFLEIRDYAYNRADYARTCLHREEKPCSPPTDEIDRLVAEMYRLESDPTVGKRELRLFMQLPMSCGHAFGNVMTCSIPGSPGGCAICGEE